MEKIGGGITLRFFTTCKNLQNLRFEGLCFIPLPTLSQHHASLFLRNVERNKAKTPCVQKHGKMFLGKKCLFLPQTAQRLSQSGSKRVAFCPIRLLFRLNCGIIFVGAPLATDLTALLVFLGRAVFLSFAVCGKICVGSLRAQEPPVSAVQPSAGRYFFAQKGLLRGFDKF